MLWKRLINWIKGHNSVTILARLCYPGEAISNNKRFCGDSFGSTLHTWVTLQSSGLFSVCPRQLQTFCALGYECVTHSSLRRETHSATRFVSPSSHGSRIRKQYTEEIQQVIEENVDKIERFASVLNCSLSEVKSLVEMDTRLVTSFSEQKVLETIKSLKSYGFLTHEILSYPPVFCLSIQSLQTRLKQMEEVRCNKIYVLKFGPKKFREMLEYFREEKKVMKSFLSRETYLAVLFSVEETDIIEASIRYPHLENYAVARLTQAYNLLREYGFSQGDIWEDLDTLLLPPAELKSRLDRMNSVGKLNKASVFPHLHYNGKDQFDRSVQVWTEDQTALDGHADKVSYLSARLQCSPAEIESMFIRYKMLKPLRPRRWKAVLDILLDDMEMQPMHILSKPVILGYSAKRLRHRCQILRDNGIRDPKAVKAYLLMTEKKFDSKFSQVVL
ncbi:uncharacterized protein LOC135464139 [Liolophura sinensis]|uniref:uncharacterized protein LOC135464139 n=1 Tax=Liolophura sinensis TaxID=3198878 RepID=UPI0031599058